MMPRTPDSVGRLKKFEKKKLFQNFSRQKKMVINSQILNKNNENLF